MQSPSPSQPIHHLAVEILTDIFLLDVHYTHQTSTPTAWTRLSLVCKHWHSTLCAASVLWRVIHIGSNPNWLRLSLERSDRSLIDVHFPAFPLGANFTVKSAVALIAPHAPRIRAILAYHDRLGDIEALFAQPHTAAALPALEELTILTVEPRAKEEKKELLPVLSGDKMRVLVLSGVSIPREPKFYTRIRVLELHEDCCSVTGFTSHDLLAALRSASPQLESLDLSHFQPHHTSESDDGHDYGAGNRQGTRDAAAVDLPRLQSYYLEHDFAFVSTLNRNISLPAYANLHLRVFLSDHDQTRHSTPEGVLAMILSPGIRPALSNPSQLTIISSSRRYCIKLNRTRRAASVHPSSSSLSPSRDANLANANFFSEVDIMGWKPHRRPGLRAILTQVISESDSRLTRLTFQSTDHDATSLHALEDWRVVLAELPALEELVLLECSGVPLGVIQALSRVRPSATRLGRQGVPEEGVGVGADLHVLCPALRVLRMESPYKLGERSSRELLASLITCLHSRMGAAKMEELRMTTWMYQLKDMPVGVRELQGKLQKMVRLC
ncbi:hypothetical protein C8Q74DRAFT_234544 [Fomes fomentarius]|nr:hypothetical protein C8Q74DRAFT_234544 [Fomes fomentarius]